MTDLRRWAQRTNQEIAARWAKATARGPLAPPRQAAEASQETSGSRPILHQREPPSQSRRQPPEPHREDRPLMHLRINELERLRKENLMNLKVLKQIRFELNHRRGARSAILFRKLSREVEDLEGSKG